MLLGLLFVAAVGVPIGARVACLAAAWFGLSLLTWACFYTWPLGAVAVAESKGTDGPLG